MVLNFSYMGERPFPTHGANAWEDLEPELLGYSNLCGVATKMLVLSQARDESVVTDCTAVVEHATCHLPEDGMGTLTSPAFAWETNPHRNPTTCFSSSWDCDNAGVSSPAAESTVGVDGVDTWPVPSGA